MPLLEVRNLTKHFGGLAAVSALDMDVKEGEILGLIGPNGAGKSTVLNMLGGTFQPSEGGVIYKGKDLRKLPSHKRARLGIARVFQLDVLFSSFTVLENLLAGSHLHFKKSVTEIFYRHAAARKQEESQHEKAMEALRFVGLENQTDELAINLPHGKMRALSLAIALATEPSLLLLDEPLTGMNAEETSTMMEMIKALREKKGITCIVVEHNMKAVIGLCDRVVVLDYGRKITEGTPKEVVNKPEVIEAYLGAKQDFFSA